MLICPCGCVNHTFTQVHGMIIESCIKKTTIMKTRIILFSFMAVATLLQATAQAFIDDIYYTPADAAKAAQKPKVNVKNGAKEIVFIGDTPVAANTTDTLDATSSAALQANNLTSSDSTNGGDVIELSEGTYLNGFNGSVSDMEYAQRIYRFHNPRLSIHISDPAYTDIYFLDESLWNVYIDPYNYAYVTPTWTNPYYFDYMYRPYSYGNWAWIYNPYGFWGWDSYWGWNSYWGFYAGWGYPYYWGGWYDPYFGYPYWHHHYHGPYYDHYAYNNEGQRRRLSGTRVSSTNTRNASVLSNRTSYRQASHTTLANNRVSGSNRISTGTSNARRSGNISTSATSSTRRLASTGSSQANRISTASRTANNSSYSSNSRRSATSSANIYNTTGRSGSSAVNTYMRSQSAEGYRTSSNTRSSNSYSMPSRTSTTSRSSSTYSPSRSNSSRSNSSSYTPRSSSTYRSSSPSYRSSSSSSFRSSGSSYSGSRSSGTSSRSSSSRR